MDITILKDITYGMYIVTTKDKNNKNVGCVINTLTQITAENPIISISLNKNNYTNQAIKENRKFSVSIISNETKKDIISTFGYYTSKDIDKFKDTKYEMIENLPIITENMCGYIIVEVTEIIDCDTHDIVIGKIINTNKISGEKVSIVNNENKNISYSINDIYVRN